jgi:hypothetical protein
VFPPNIGRCIHSGQFISADFFLCNFNYIYMTQSLHLLNSSSSPNRYRPIRFIDRSLLLFLLLLLTSTSWVLAKASFEPYFPSAKKNSGTDVYDGSFKSEETGKSNRATAFYSTAALHFSDKTFGGPGYDRLTVMIETADGGFLYGGASASGAGGEKSEEKKGNNDEFNYDYWVIKVNSAGEKVWDRSYGGTGYDALTSLIETREGGYLLGGYSWSSQGEDKSEDSQGDSDYWIVKIDQEGRKLWDRTYGGADHDFLVSLHQTNDGGYLLSGESSSGVGADKTAASKGNSDFWVIKVDQEGRQEWDRGYGGDNWEWLSAVVSAPDGGFLLAGTSNSGIGGDKSAGRKGEKRFWDGDYWVLKISGNGTKQWDHTFGSDGQDELTAAILTADGGYLLGGSTEVFSTAGSGSSLPDEFDDELEYMDYWVLKINSNGAVDWQRKYGGDGLDKLAALVATADGGYLLGGSSTSGSARDKTEPGRGESDYWVINVSNRGDIIWDRTLGGAKIEELKNMLQTADGGFLVGGNSSSGKSGDKTEASRGSQDFWVARLTPVNLTSPEPGGAVAGTLRREYWAGVPGSKVSDIPLNKAPTSISFLNQFEAPANIGDHYGTRIRGYVHPPQTGNYTFWIAGDDNCELWLSSNENPQAKKRIAFVGGYTNSRQWDKYASQKSQPVRLKAGKKYYIEVLHKENRGGDHVAVGWHLPGGVKEAPIPGGRLSPFIPTDKKTDEPSIITRMLHQEPVLTAFPNPFIDKSILSFRVQEAGQATLEVYDLNGRLIRQLFSGTMEAGSQQQFEIDGRDMARGVYLARLVTGQKVQTRRLVLSR